MTKTFTYTERILEGLNGTIMNLNAPNKLDTGLNNSAVAQNAINNGNGWIKKVLGQTTDPGQISDWVAKYKGKEFGDKFYNSVRTKPVNLLEILYLQGQEFKEAVNIPSANYVFLFENNGMYSLGGVYYQMFGDSQQVCVDYKGVKATVVDGGKYGDYLHDSASFRYQEAAQYIEKNGDSIIDQVKQRALSMYTTKTDRDVVHEFLATGPAPSIIYNSVAMGVIDSANIPKKSMRGMPTTAKYIVAPYIFNKDLLIYNKNKTAGTLGDFGPLPRNVKADVDSKLNEVMSSENPYGENVSNLTMAMDLQRRNPIRTYSTIVKGCESAVNWMVGDMKSIIGTTNFTGGDDIFFSSPTIEEVFKTIGNKVISTPGYEIAIIRAFKDYNDFPLQIRSFTSHYDYKTEQYVATIKPDKLIVIFPGFNNYIRQKAKSDGLSGGDGYVKVIQDLPTTENSSFKAAGVIDLQIFYKTLSRLYTDSGFSEGILFKFLPPILAQANDKKYIICTSMDDLSDKELPYMADLDETDKSSDVAMSFPKYYSTAANILFDPFDDPKDPKKYNKDIDGFGSPMSEKSMDLQNTLIGTFHSLEDIAKYLSADLDRVKDHSGLMEVGNKFQKVLKNLSNGFWTVMSNDNVVAKTLTGPKNQHLLGFYNLLGKGESNLGDINIPILDLKSLEKKDLFIERRITAIKEAEGKFTSKRNKPVQAKRS